MVQGQGPEPRVSDSKCVPETGATGGLETAVLATGAASLSRNTLGKAVSSHSGESVTFRGEGGPPSQRLEKV